MKRLVILTAGVALLLSTGCTHNWSVKKALGLDSPAPTGELKDPKTGAPIKLPDQKIAERVELVGKQIVARNTFSGLNADEILFSTIGVQENALFHTNTEHLWISEGLVKQCQSDAELTAVLCSELGQMLSEKRNARAVGRDVDPIPDVNYGGGNLFPGGNAFNAGREVEMRLHEKKYPRGANTDPAKISRELLQNAGYNALEMDRVEGLVKNSNRGEELKKQIAGPAASPTWQK